MQESVYSAHACNENIKHIFLAIAYDTQIILNFSCIIFRIRKLKLQNYSTALVSILSCTKLIIEY